MLVNFLKQFLNKPVFIVLGIKLLYFIYMNILLSNDDGYMSTGINLLLEKLKKYGKVVVVAPKNAMSAKSISITLGKPIQVQKIDENIYAVDGTPADAVAFGLSSLDIKFDLVVSGCNHGWNISYDTMYSGTIGVCLQALTYEVPAIAISCEGNFEILTGNFEKVMDYIFKNKLLSKEYLLNVNFPLGNIVEDIKMTSLYYRKETTYYIHQSENNYLAWRDLHDEECEEIDTDVYAVQHRMISITKLYKTNDLKEI